MRIENKVGFRIKIEFPAESTPFRDIETIFHNYFSHFDIMEIKLNNSLMNYREFSRIVDIYSEINKNALSLHLPSNTLYDFGQKTEIDHTVRYLNSINLKEGTRLIAHFPKEPDIVSLLDKTRELVNNLPHGTILVLENIDNCFNINAHIDNINHFFERLDEHLSQRVLFCIDFGHMFYNALKSQIKIENIFSMLESYPYLVSRIGEIHIHDFNSCDDHLPLRTGQLPLEEILTYLIKKNILSPIILETSIKDLFRDGEEQVKYLSMSV